MADKPSNIESLSSSVSSSREGETPQPLEEKKDECLPVSHSVSAENQPPQLDRWQPISTAPIGVTEVLLCWQDGVSAPMFKTGYNLGDGRRWQDTHQWLHNEHSWPTHWMPLPPPPECVDCEAILRRDPPFGVALALPNPPEADKPNNSSSSSVSSSREGETPLRCAACGASTDSPLTARNISAYPSCAACGAVSSISKREGETPLKAEEKKDDSLLGGTGGGSTGDWKPVESARERELREAFAEGYTRADSPWTLREAWEGSRTWLKLQK
jgi:hypothetical protein